MSTSDSTTSDSTTPDSTTAGNVPSFTGRLVIDEHGDTLGSVDDVLFDPHDETPEYLVVNPGLLRRRDALMLAARKAVLLVLGCIPVLITAGVIEGFLSPNAAVPWPVKWTVGVFSGLLFYGYLWLAARRAGATASSSL